MSMSTNLKLTFCLGGLLVPWLLASVPSVAADEALKLNTAVTLGLLPNGNHAVLRSFDISFVDPRSRTYALAASSLFCSTMPSPPACAPTAIGPGSMPGVVTIDTETKMAKLLAVGEFAGSCSIPPARDTYSGPNGLIIIHNGEKKEIWVGDGPIFNTSCSPGSGVKTASSVKVLDLKTGAITHTISTGGQRRADELCYNPFTNVVLMANDDPLDNFITFISTETYKVLGSISFNGKDKRGDNILANGIEQCAFNPRDNTSSISH